MHRSLVRRSRLAAALAFACLALVGAAGGQLAAAAAQPPPTAGIAGARAEEGGLAARLTVGSHSFSLHEPIVSQLEIVNRTQHSIHLDLGLERKSRLRLLMTSPSGRAEIGNEDTQTGQVGAITMAPGESFHETLILNQWRCCEVPGAYSVSPVLPDPQEVGVHVDRDVEPARFEVSAYDRKRVATVCASFARIATSAGEGEAAKRVALEVLELPTDDACLPVMETVLRSNGEARPAVLRGLARRHSPGAVAAVVRSWGAFDWSVRAIAEAEFAARGAGAELRAALEHAGLSGATASIPGLAVTAVPDRAVFSLHEPITVAFRFTNSADKPLSFVIARLASGAFVYMKLTIPPANGARSEHHLEEEADEIFTNARISLASGESASYMQVLNQWYPFAQEGEYEVRAAIPITPALKEDVSPSDPAATVVFKIVVGAHDAKELKETCERLVATAAVGSGDASQARQAIRFAGSEECIPSLRAALSKLPGPYEALHALAAVGTGDAAEAVASAWTSLHDYEKRYAKGVFDAAGSGEALRRALVKRGLQ